jgi:dTDP-L-rhamnose 4-epimerase
MRVLITGGAGFIGTHLCRRLLLEGYELTVVDAFIPQVHGEYTELASDLVGHIELVRADIRDSDRMSKAVMRTDAVIHLAAETGTGQSMYALRRYEDSNLGGTAVLMESLLANKADLRSLILASSRAVYGEGAYWCGEHQTVYPKPRRLEDLLNGQFEPRCPICATYCTTTPTPENAPFQPCSFYGLTKQGQEEMMTMFGDLVASSVVRLRFQNVFGPGQSLLNPYTGILAVFCTRARAGLPIDVFEDGSESRDFVYVADVVDAIVLALRAQEGHKLCLNVGTGTGTKVLDIARDIVRLLGSNSEVRVTGAFRQGDIRHCTGDLTRIREAFGFSPKWTFEQGLNAFLAWAKGQENPASRFEKSVQELREKGLFHA